MKLAAAILTFTCVASGQKFEVASIKPANPDPHAMFGIRHMPGGGINAANVTLKLLITNAYGLQDFQISGGQKWIETALYNIEAKPDLPGGPNEWKVMLQNLLVDRFHLAFHRETKELPIYALVLARKDGKLGTANDRIEGRRLRGARSVEADGTTGAGPASILRQRIGKRIAIHRHCDDRRRHGPDAIGGIRRPQGDR
jgi:uncharacterized protein (TIGR03435 family)